MVEAGELARTGPEGPCTCTATDPPPAPLRLLRYDRRQAQAERLERWKSIPPAERPRESACMTVARLQELSEAGMLHLVLLPHLKDRPPDKDGRVQKWRRRMAPVMAAAVSLACLDWRHDAVLGTNARWASFLCCSTDHVTDCLNELEATGYVIRIFQFEDFPGFIARDGRELRQPQKYTAVIPGPMLRALHAGWRSGIAQARERRAQLREEQQARADALALEAAQAAATVERRELAERRRRVAAVLESSDHHQDRIASDPKILIPPQELIDAPRRTGSPVENRGAASGLEASRGPRPSTAELFAPALGALAKSLDAREEHRREKERRTEELRERARLITSMGPRLGAVVQMLRHAGQVLQALGGGGDAGAARDAVARAEACLPLDPRSAGRAAREALAWLDMAAREHAGDGHLDTALALLDQVVIKLPTS